MPRCARPPSICCASWAIRSSTAESGERALELLKGGTEVDLLFTDVVMPGSVGSRELARQATALLPGLFVLYTSGYTENAIIHHGRLDPGVHLLSKPYGIEELGRKLRLVFAGAPGDAARDATDGRSWPMAPFQVAGAAAHTGLRHERPHRCCWWKTMRWSPCRPWTC